MHRYALPLLAAPFLAAPAAAEVQVTSTGPVVELTVNESVEAEPDIELGDWVVQRRCPHRNADLAVFGEIEGCELVCTLHGWRFDLETGRCLTADDRSLRVRRRDSTIPTG